MQTPVFSDLDVEGYHQDDMIFDRNGGIHAREDPPIRCEEHIRAVAEPAVFIDCPHR